jgi:hypothetical protein
MRYPRLSQVRVVVTPSCRGCSSLLNACTDHNHLYIVEDPPQHPGNRHILCFTDALHGTLSHPILQGKDRVVCFFTCFREFELGYAAPFLLAASYPTSMGILFNDIVEFSRLHEGLRYFIDLCLRNVTSLTDDIQNLPLKAREIKIA